MPGKTRHFGHDAPPFLENEDASSGSRDKGLLEVVAALRYWAAWSITQIMAAIGREPAGRVPKQNQRGSEKEMGAAIEDAGSANSTPFKAWPN